MPAGPRRARLLLADSHLLVVEALARALEASAHVVVAGTATTTAEATALASRAEADVAVVGYDLLQEGSGALAAALRAAHPALKLIALTPDDDEETTVQCVRLGTAGAFALHRPFADLVAAIARVRAGEVLFPSDFLIRMLARPEPRPKAPEPVEGRGLAPREAEVLQLMARGLSTDEVADQLGITAHTVRTHVKHAMAKMMAHSKVEAILIAVRNGWIELPD